MNTATLAKTFLPLSIHSRLRPAWRQLRRLHWPHYCLVCEQKVNRFSPLPAFYNEQLRKHGSDLRLEDCETCNWNAYSCPWCSSSDRDRLYALYLARRLQPCVQPNFRLLDIAPARALSRHIRRRYSIFYRTADLYMDGVDDRVDLTQMDCYPDASFDAFICSHVLEHVQDDRKAMAELRRILKPGGWGIAMVPIALHLNGIREDPLITSENERWKYFGQGDHVRFYSRAGFLERLYNSGFRVLELDKNFFGSAEFVKHGIATRSVLYVVH